MGILVLGIGNVLLADEGIGVHVVRALETGYDLPADVTVIDGGTSGMDLLDALCAAEAVAIVDCADLGEAPGSLREIEGEGVPAFFRTRISPHQIGLSDLMAAAVLLERLPARFALIAVQPASTELALELSPEGRKAAEAALARLVVRLGQWGRAPVPRVVQGASGLPVRAEA